MILLDGKIIAQQILDEVKAGVGKLFFEPVFCDILVGDDPASAQYVKMKGRTAETVGIQFRQANYPASISTEQLIQEIKQLNQEPHMCGLIVQLPLPGHIDTKAVLDSIDPKIDVDCTGEVNTGLFYSGNAYMEFPTALAVMKVLETCGIDFKQKKFLVVGFGQLVGRPVSYLLKQKGYKVDVAQNSTENILELMKQADVVISATGKAGLITGDKIKPGSIILDAGTSESDGGITGDVDFGSVKDIAGYISPVPGGVGPVTVAMLLGNVLKVASSTEYG